MYSNWAHLSYTRVNLEYIVHVPAQTCPTPGARPYQAFTQLLEALLFNDKHLLVTGVTVSTEHPYIHILWYNFILHDEFK